MSFRQLPDNGAAARTKPFMKPSAFSVALMNLKGGTGKTTLAVALCEALPIIFKARTLIVDCDFQYSASIALLGRAKAGQCANQQRTLEYAILNGLDDGALPGLDDYIISDPLVACEAEGQVALLPAGPDMPRIERRIVEHFLKRNDLTKAYDRAADYIADTLRPVLNEYECVVFDCPPGITLFSEAAVKACEHLVVPTLPNEISIAAVEHLRSEIDRIRPKKSFDQLHAGTVISKMRHRNASNHRMAQLHSIDRLLDRMDSKFKILKPYLPFCGELEAATCRDPKGAALTFATRYGSATRLVEQLAFAVVQNIVQRQGRLEAAE